MSDPLPARPSYFATPRTYQITGDALVVTSLAKPGASATPSPPESIPLQHITEVRLSHYPARFAFNRFRCRCKTSSGATHTLINALWQGPVAEKDLSAEYRAFVTGLCRGVAAANPHALFLRGRTHLALIVENSITFALVALLIGVWIVLKPSLHWFQILNLILIATYLPIAISSWRRNRPGRFDPHAIPSEILPSTSA